MRVTDTFAEILRALPIATQLRVLHGMVDDLQSGKDETIAALRHHAEQIAARLVLVGGVAVIAHGYPRPTIDRDVLVDYRMAGRLADRLMDDPDWERLEIRQYAFVYHPTGVQVDFLVSRDLIQLGRPYYFPDLDQVETLGAIEGVPVLGLHDLLYLKLLAGRMRDLADIMELCKRHLDKIDPQRVLAPIEAEDQDLRDTFLNLLKQAPIELANERRLGQGSATDYRRTPSDSG